MLFNKQIKAHWLSKVAELGDRFDPDCGTRAPQYEFSNAAPLNLLTGLYGKDALWASYEEEFQLPRWLLEVIDTYMHDVSPRTSQADLTKVLEACPTYADLDLAYHLFTQKITLYCIEHFSDICAQLATDTYFGTVWVSLYTNERLLYQRKGASTSCMLEINEGHHRFEYWGTPGNAYNYFNTMISAIKNRYTAGLPESLHALHKLAGDDNTREQCGEVILNMLIATLKEI